MPIHSVVDTVTNAIQLALLLEVSAYPKPGNVHRTADLTDLSYEQFLAAIVSMSPTFRSAALRGARCASGELTIEEIRVGALIKDAVERMMSSQGGGNTHLGSIILLIPLAAAGAIRAIKGKSTMRMLRRDLTRVLTSATPSDTVDLYDAIAQAKPGGLGRVEKLDVNDPGSKKTILSRHITPYEVFEMAAEYDTIAREWTTGYRITFDFAYPYFKRIRKTAELNDAIVNTFLRILAEVPDTFIVRKFGLGRAEEASKMAREVLDAGGMLTDNGSKMVWNLDARWREEGVNPGTTADLISSTLSIATLRGLRP